MPKVIINSEEYSVNEGELLLDVARRNGAHIGFVCDGKGICSTCECKILEGAELLSKPNLIEKQWLSEARLDEGHRLGCQATLESGAPEGTVVVLTRVEELKQQFVSSLLGPRRITSLLRLFTTITGITVNHLQMAPAGIPGSIKRLGIGGFLFPWGMRIGGWFKDAARVLEKQTGFSSIGKDWRERGAGTTSGRRRRGDGDPDHKVVSPYRGVTYKPRARVKEETKVTNGEKKDKAGTKRPATGSTTAKQGTSKAQSSTWQVKPNATITTYRKTVTKSAEPKPVSKLDDEEFEDISIPKKDKK